MKRQVAVSLVELVVAIGFLAIAAIMVLSLLPAGIMSLNQAENLETATSLASMLVEEAAPPGGPSTESLTFELNHTTYTCVRTYENVTGELYDVRVTVNWNGAQRPVELWMRKATGT